MEGGRTGGGGGGVGGGGFPSFSWTTGTRNQFQSVNLFYWECKNERFCQFNPTCMRYFLIHPKRSALESDKSGRSDCLSRGQALPIQNWHYLEMS